MEGEKRKAEVEAFLIYFQTLLLIYYTCLRGTLDGILIVMSLFLVHNYKTETVACCWRDKGSNADKMYV
jgi:hypothetical protein